MFHLRKQIGRDFVAERPGANAFQVYVGMAHPSRLGMAHSIEHGVNSDTAWITADDVIPDQPWRVNNEKDSERNYRGPTARPEEKRAEDQRGNEHPNREGVS